MNDSILLSLLVRSALILSAANIARHLLMRNAPASQHRIVLASFGFLLIWPLLAVTIPEIYIPLWVPRHTGASVAIEQKFLMPLAQTRISRAPSWTFLIWLGGVAITLTPVALGHLRLRVITRRAAPATDPAIAKLLGATCVELGITRRPKLLLYPGSTMPLTFGLRRPRILLPEESVAWTRARQRTVLLHELAHVKRRDLAAQLFANLVTAVWWFQPLSWRQRWVLRHESERACDALVVAAGVRPSEYAAELLALAHELRRGQHWSAAAITMAQRGELEGRLRTILEGRSKNHLRTRSAGAVAVLAMFTVTASAVSLFPQQGSESEGGSHMKRTLLSGLLTSAGLSAATIGGSLFDPSGAVVPGAKALLYNPDTAAKQETTTAPDGKFAFENLPAGAYILRVAKPGFASLFREFNVQEDSKVERGLTLNLDSLEQDVKIEAAGKAAASSQTPAVQRIRVGGEVAQSHLTTKVQPIYPSAAKAAGVQGKVVLETVISVEGLPQDIRVLESPSDELSQSALEAVRQWRYTPTLLNGKQVEVVTQVLVNYTLSK